MEPNWKKPAECEGDTDCPNWAYEPDGTLVLRDSEDPAVELRFSAKDAASFLRAVHNGEVAPQA